MPNHCENRVDIDSEDAEDIKEIIVLLSSEKTPFDFSKIFPEPDYEKTDVLFLEYSLFQHHFLQLLKQKYLLERLELLFQ